MKGGVNDTPGTITKAHIIDAVVEQNGFTRKQSMKTVEAMLELIKSELEPGHEAMISGFDKFCLKTQTKRKGRIPATGNYLIIAPRKVVAFKWSGNLKKY